MVNQDLVNKTIRLINQGLIKIADIKNIDYKMEVISYYKSEVVKGTLTEEQFQEVTGEVYIA